MSALTDSASPSPICRHCSNRPALPHKRGLCANCYTDPEIVVQYQRLKYSGYVRDVDDDGSVIKLPATPTKATPGTETKILVLIARISRKEALHHPLDRHLRHNDDRPTPIHLFDEEEYDD